MNKILLDLYSDYLISSFNKTTATGMSELLDKTISHDRITDFLAESHLTSKELWKLIKKDVRNIESPGGVLIIDDSVKGINLLSCLYHSQGYELPLCFDIITKERTFLDPKTGKEKRKSLITNIIVHGSHGDQTNCNYSDIDLTLVLSDNVLKSMIKNNLKIKKY